MPRLITLLVCSLFAIKALVLIDATGLWSDELYSVGKSFQPSLTGLLAMLRNDTHPPLYYIVLWVWGQVLAQTPLTLRLLSWLAYLAGAALVVRQSAAMTSLGSTRTAVSVAALLMICSPYPIRFSVEGKSYALLVALVALSWWCRRRWLEGRGAAWTYGLSVALASLTHFYGAFLFAAAAGWDGWQRRWPLARAALIGLLPTTLWIVYASTYLFSSRSGSWIGVPDFALLEDTLARGLGWWPLPRLLVMLAVVLLLRRRGLTTDGGELDRSARWRLLDRSGLIPSGLMVLAVVLVSFLKPLAFSRYFVVLVPAVVTWLAVETAALSFNRLGRRLLAVMVSLLLLGWWFHSFREIRAGGVREQSNFRAVSRLTAGMTERFSPRPRLFNLSDRMEGVSQVPWRDEDELDDRLNVSPAPTVIWLAASGPEPVMRRRLLPLERRVRQAGYRCEVRSAELANARVLLCTAGET